VKIKSKARDFRVRELLDEGYLQPRGRHRVYLVTKTKLTSLEAAATLADMAGVSASAVGIAGLKDRQGVTTQYMSVPSKKPVFLRTRDLRIEPAGFAQDELTSARSSGNAFELTLRGISRGEREKLQAAIAEVREQGVPNYFGEQRFGNLRYNQGWIARDLALGSHERALKELLCARSENDNERNSRFKSALAARWDDWRACRDIAGKFGAHHSIFEYLARHDGDFAGAFQHVATRVRLIHLYAWQSHLWNRAVARYVEEITPAADRIEASAPEGRLFFSRVAMAIDPTMNNAFRLPGEMLADVAHARQRQLLTEALAREGLKPEEFRIKGVPGFQLKGEDRALIVHPRELRVTEVRDDARTRADEGGGARLRIGFELPRGAYATLVLMRLLESERRASAHERDDMERDGRGPADRGPRGTQRGGRGPARDEQRGRNEPRGSGAPRGRAAGPKAARRNETRAGFRGPPARGPGGRRAGPPKRRDPSDRRGEA
jgi:tRNA pseudouridine13 synthase